MGVGFALGTAGLKAVRGSSLASKKIRSVLHGGAHGGVCIEMLGRREVVVSCS